LVAHELSSIGWANTAGAVRSSSSSRCRSVAAPVRSISGYRREHLPAIEEGRAALFGNHKPADALVGVERLSKPEFLIEVDAIAVIDG
jgi:enamine deaminase RidA (YjgF/YER057c/UK114 family)